MTEKPEKSAKDLVQTYLQYMGQRNLDVIVKCFANQVDWYIPGNSELAPWLGKRTNKTEVKEFFQKLWKETVPLDASIDCILCEANHAVIVGNFSTKMLATDKIFHSPFTMHMQFSDQKIIYYRLMEDSFGLSQVLSKKQ